MYLDLLLSVSTFELSTILCFVCASLVVAIGIFEVSGEYISSVAFNKEVK